MRVTFMYQSPSGNKYNAAFDTVTKSVSLVGHGQNANMHFVHAPEPLQLQATAAKVAAVTKNRQNRAAFLGN